VVLDIKLFRICEFCNKEFELKNPDKSQFGENSLDNCFTQEKCPHCEKYNNIWIRLNFLDEI